MKLSYLEEFIDDDGQISLGNMSPVGCVAVASDESNMLALLKRRPEESVMALLERLDQAIGRALEHDEYLDEVNTP